MQSFSALAVQAQAAVPPAHGPCVVGDGGSGMATGGLIGVAICGEPKRSVQQVRMGLYPRARDSPNGPLRPASSKGKKAIG